MPLSDLEKQKLFAKLEVKGWCWKGQFIHAPNNSMWLQIAEPWQADLNDFHERMSARLQRIIDHRSHYTSDAEHQKVVDDTRSLVDVLKDMARSGNGETHNA